MALALWLTIPPLARTMSAGNIIPESHHLNRIIVGVATGRKDPFNDSVAADQFTGTVAADLFTGRVDIGHYAARVETANHNRSQSTCLVYPGYSEPFE